MIIWCQVAYFIAFATMLSRPAACETLYEEQTAESDDGIHWYSNYDHLGVYAWKGGETTQIKWNSTLRVMMVSCNIEYREDGTQITNVTQAWDHRYFAATLDRKRHRMWVFGTAHQRFKSPGGPCDPSVAKGCYVGAWYSDDLIHWSNTSVAVTLPDGQYAYNNDVTFTVTDDGHRSDAGGTLPAHQAVMVIEWETGHTGAPLRYFAINTGDDGDLSRNWQVLSAEYYGVIHACPSIRWIPEPVQHGHVPGTYYVLGGGTRIDIAKSSNLSTGSWQESSMNPVVEPSRVLLSNGSLVSLDAKIAPYYATYWKESAPQEAWAFLPNMTNWNRGTSDVDVCCEGDEGPAMLNYFVNNQGPKLPNQTAGESAVYSAIGKDNRPLFQWLQSYFPED